MTMDLSVVVPIYNEENSIDTFSKNLIKIKKQFHRSINIEFILVNDGSTDNTLDRLLLLNTKNLNYKIINKEKNKGYGAALKTGIRKALSNNIFIIDCDSTYPVDKIYDHYKLYLNNKHDMLIGDRSKSILSRTNIFLDPKFYGRNIIRLFAIILTKKKINDLNSGYRFFKKDLIINFLKILPDRFSFSSTSTIIFILNDCNLKYVDIDYYKRVGKSKIRPFYDFFNFINLILSILIYIKPLKIFLPLFSISFISGFSLIMYRLLFGSQYLFTGSILLIISILFLFIGYLFDFLIRINFNED